VPMCSVPVAPRAGLRIQRMPSEPDTEFGEPAAYPYMCVASPSCHDTSTTRAWYEDDPARRQRFYNNVRSPSSLKPVTDCWPTHADNHSAGVCGGPVHCRICLPAAPQCGLHENYTSQHAKLESGFLRRHWAWRAERRTGARRRSCMPSSGSTWSPLPYGPSSPSRQGLLQPQSGRTAELNPSWEAPPHSVGLETG
jgi:hypothetical protein